MTFAPDRRVLGVASLTITTATGTRTVTLTHEGSADKESAYIEGTSFNWSLVEQTTGLTPPAGEWFAYVVEDVADPGNNYETTDGGGTLSPGVLAGINLGTGGGLFAAGTFGAGGGFNPAIEKGGTYRIVLCAGDTDARARRIAAVTDTGLSSAQYHQDSDGGSSNGTLGATGSSRDIGGCGHRVVWTARDATGATGAGGAFRNKDTMVLTGSIRPANATSAAIINPKQLKIALATDAAGATRPDGVYRVTPNTTGDFTQGGIPVDTDFGQVLGGTDHYHHLGVDNVLGDTSTPAAEKAGIWSTGTIVGIDPNTEGAALMFATSGHVASTTQVSAGGQLRSTNTEVTASAALQLSSTDPASSVTPGVLAYNETGRTNLNKLFNRRQSASVDGPHGHPYFRAWVADAYDDAFESKAVQLITLDSDGTSENSQALTTDANGRVDWDFQLGDTVKAFNAFTRTSPDDPDSLGAHDLAVATADIHKPSGTKTNEYPDPKNPTTTRDFAAATIPGRAKDIRVQGRAFSSGKEPTTTEADQIAVAAEIIFEGMYSGNTTDDTNDSNGVPTDPVTRSKVTAAGSFICKTASLIDEAAFGVADDAAQNPTDRAGRPFDFSGGFEFVGRRALFNRSSSPPGPSDTGTNLGSQQDLETPLGYSIHGTSAQTFDTIAATSDAATLGYYQGFASTTGQRGTFGLASGSTETPGFTGDSGLYGFKQQVLEYNIIRDDLYGQCIVDKKLVTTGGSVRWKMKAYVVLPDKSLVPSTFDDAPVLYVGIENGPGVPLSNVATVTATPIGALPTGDYEATYTPPAPAAGTIESYGSVGFAKIQGSRATVTPTSFNVGVRDNSLNMTVFSGDFTLSGRHWIRGDTLTVTPLILRATGGIPESVSFLTDEQTHSVTAVSQGSKTFTIAGDQTTDFADGLVFSIAGSTGNDGTYRIVSTTFTGGNTVITVLEDIPSSVADGTITLDTEQPKMLVLNAIGGNLQPDGTFAAPLALLGTGGTWPASVTEGWPLQDLFLFVSGTADDSGLTTPLEASVRFPVVGDKNAHDSHEADNVSMVDAGRPSLR